MPRGLFTMAMVGVTAALLVVVLIVGITQRDPTSVATAAPAGTDSPEPGDPAEPAPDVPAVEPAPETESVDTPAVDVLPAPDDPAPDEPIPDEPIPDEPAPDEPIPDEPAPEPEEPAEPAPDVPAVEPAPDTESVDTPAVDVLPAPDDPAPDDPAPDEPAPDDPVPDDPVPDEPAPDDPGEPDELVQLSVVTSFGGITDAGGEVRFEITVTNRGTTPIAVEEGDVQLVGPDGPLESVPGPDRGFDAVELGPRESANGSIVFDVPPGSVGLILRVAPPGGQPVEIRL